jgi:catechol 2,3-dioxygenase-like lactoylglutathione lyase family enzyme
VVERVAAAGGRLSVLGLDHVQLAMPRGGEEAARAFYAGVLGMAEVPKPEPMRAAGGIWFRAGSAELHLGVEDDFRPARKAHPALRVEELDALAERCAAAGHRPEWDERYPGVRRFYVADPFGNRVEILRPEP